MDCYEIIHLGSLGHLELVKVGRHHGLNNLSFFIVLYYEAKFEGLIGISHIKEGHGIGGLNGEPFFPFGTAKLLIFCEICKYFWVFVITFGAVSS